MKWEKAQIEVFKAILKGDLLCRGYDEKTENGNVFVVTPDGFHGFVFPKGLVAFDTENVELVGRYLDTTIACEENKLTSTNRLVEHGKTVARVFEGKHGEVLINKAFLVCYEDCEFYQEAEFGVVLITEYGAPVGFALPIKKNDDE